MKHAHNIVLLGVLVLCLVLVTGCLEEFPKEQKEERVVPKVVKGEKGEAPKTPITISLSMPTTPLLNEVTKITATVNSILDAPDTTARIILPEGVTLVSGDLIWEGDLKAGIPTSFSANIKFTKVENVRIEAVANHIIDDENSWGDIDVIYVNYSTSQEVETEQSQKVESEQVEDENKEPPSSTQKGKDDLVPPSISVT